jgi:hypothetical protein
MKASKNKKIFWELAKHHCLIFLILLILALVGGGSLFYKNFILIKEREPEVISSKIQIDREFLETLLEELKEREKSLREIESKTYSNPFQEATSTSEEEVGEQG